MMKFLFFVTVVILGVANATADKEKHKDHNEAEHKALCNLLKAAVTKWGDSGETLSDPLKKALGKTIFGEGAKQDLSVLREGMPVVYMDVLKVPGSRSVACGQRYNDAGGELSGILEEQPRWSGHSAPHDLVCLCTAGSHGWPVNESSQKDRLCGKDRGALKAEGSKGWGGMNAGYAVQWSEQIQATWENVTKECLNADGQSYNLKDFIEKFKEKLGPEQHDVMKRPRRQLGQGQPDRYGACDGSEKQGVCVMYYESAGHTPWWVDLEKALIEDENLQKQREEEAKKRQKELEQKQELPKTEASKSAPPTNNQTERHQNNNITDTIRKFNLTSGTLITTPCSWLISAILLI
ncbi:Variant surface glycoprotein [Trypanosoma congolense IL3000]|uniref:Variant surface glycoprotein n=1 Tax=Trypanosoma congolense (strain IL3000) TaxID=1068625 RepID=F9WH83_TRYCI|nr:Variant surface glycoprotein [Trypanosoma congolense IL3000]